MPFKPEVDRAMKPPCRASGEFFTPEITILTLDIMSSRSYEDRKKDCRMGMTLFQKIRNVFLIGSSQPSLSRLPGSCQDDTFLCSTQGYCCTVL